MTLRSSMYAVFAVLFIGIIPGEMFKLYDTIPYFDKYLHFAGGVVIALFLSLLLRKERHTMPPWTFALLIVSATTLVGVFWEFAEHLSGYFAQDTLPLVYRYFHGGELADTLADLAMDIIGASALVAVNPKIKSSRES